jgi:hypothetical protein
MSGSGYARGRTVVTSVSVELDRFVDQHDRDIVPDRVHEPTGVANESVTGRIQRNLAFTLRANQDFKEIRTDGHIHASPRRIIPGMHAQNQPISAPQTIRRSAAREAARK